MTSEYLGITIADLLEMGEEIPKPSPINQLSLIHDDLFKDDPELKDISDMDRSFISMIITDVSHYLEQNQPVKKTLTIPSWANTLGKKLNINFSQTLTDAIVEKQMESGR